MNSYSNLVSKILNNECLAKEIKNYSGCLNLISSDWMSRLKNNIIFQDFSSQSTGNLWKQAYGNDNYQYEDSTRPNFHVLIAGYCKFPKPFAGKINKPGIMVMESEPLIDIAHGMTSDLGSSIQISNDFKFNFEECGVLSCNECRINAEIFSKAGYKVTRLNQPCINDTRVFDGKDVVSRFLSHIESMYNQTFIAILLLNINSRYSYTDSNKQTKHRITGEVLDFIGFNESKLTLCKKVNLGYLTNFEGEVATDKKRKNEEHGFIEELMKQDIKKDIQSKRRKETLPELENDNKRINEEEVCLEDLMIDIQDVKKENMGCEEDCCVEEEDLLLT